jgi:hypothetical protein
MRIQKITENGKYFINPVSLNRGAYTFYALPSNIPKEQN